MLAVIPNLKQPVRVLLRCDLDDCFVAWDLFTCETAESRQPAFAVPEFEPQTQADDIRYHSISNHLALAHRQLQRQKLSTATVRNASEKQPALKERLKLWPGQPWRDDSLLLQLRDSVVIARLKRFVIGLKFSQPAEMEGSGEPVLRLFSLRRVIGVPFRGQLLTAIGVLTPGVVIAILMH